MILSTTNNLEDMKIRQYKGVITGEAIIGVNMFKDIFANIRDLVGGRSATYEKELENARQIALRVLSEKATALGANAVIGIDLDYETLGTGNGMLMVTASGTAVVVE
ncbi:MAG: heavy metal-binding domain-containing protein [Patescibacteria group bacterium]